MSSFRDFSNPSFIISSCLELESEYEKWAKTCPPSFLYETVTLERESEEVFSDHYHSYPSIWTATIWNYYRCVRILVNELLLEQLEYLSQNNSTCTLPLSDTYLSEAQIRTQIQASKSTLLRLCHDICSSVPFFLGFNPKLSCSLRILPKAVNGNMLLWPLYAVGVTAYVSDMMRSWAARRLQWIADCMGIRQAAPLALTLGRRMDILEWQMEGGDLGLRPRELYAAPTGEEREKPDGVSGVLVRNYSSES